MHAALVGEGARADVGLIVADGQIGQLGDVPRGRGQMRQALFADGGVPHLQLEVGDDRDQVGVAAALAVAVGAALDMRESLVDRGQRIGHRQFGIVMRVDPQNAVEVLAHVGADFREPAGEHPAVGIAQAQNVGAGFLRGFERAQGEIAIGAIAVEEMLGVVDHFLAVVLEVLHGVGDDLEVLALLDSQGAMDVQVPALAENRHDRRAGGDQRIHAGVLFDGIPGEAGRAESD